MRADPPLCILCQYAVQYADTLLENNATEAQIIKGLGKAENYFKFFAFSFNLDLIF